MEDIGRFMLDRSDLTEAAKRLRHEVTAAVGLVWGDPVRTLAARDTGGDVGTGITTKSEMNRTTVRDVALAAASRATEALRCLEESAKLLGSEAAARRLERARYDAYTLERELVLSLPSGSAGQWRLCVLVTEALCRHHSWEGVVGRAISGGADCVQLREKELEDGQFLRRAERLVEMCRSGPRKVAVIVNDRVDIAMLSKADGVHLGQGDVPVRRARELLGSGAVIGVSTSSVVEAREARGMGADYVGLGPMYPTTTKKKERLAGPALVREVMGDEMLAGVPHLAIGGIGPERMGELRDAGVRGVAVSSVVCGAEDPGAVCREILGHVGPVR